MGNSMVIYGREGRIELPDPHYACLLYTSSITTEDNKNFIVHIDDAATWSDGTPVTADDVVYTALRLASPVIGNTAMMYYVFEGVGDDGFVEEGACLLYTSRCV